MDIKKIGNAMKLLRNSKNWSLEEESSFLNIHRNTLMIYEDNPENMGLGLFEKFLEIHKITLENFFKLVYDNSLNNSEK